MSEDGKQRSDAGLAVSEDGAAHPGGGARDPDPGHNPKPHKSSHHKEHKSHKSSKSSKHKKHSKSHKERRRSSSEDAPPLGSRQPPQKQADEVGSDPESGEILAAEKPPAEHAMVASESLVLTTLSSGDRVVVAEHAEGNGTGAPSDRCMDKPGGSPPDDLPGPPRDGSRDAPDRGQRSRAKGERDKERRSSRDRDGDRYASRGDRRERSGSPDRQAGRRRSRDRSASRERDREREQRDRHSSRGGDRDGSGRGGRYDARAGAGGERYGGYGERDRRRGSRERSDARDRLDARDRDGGRDRYDRDRYDRDRYARDRYDRYDRGRGERDRRRDDGGPPRPQRSPEPGRDRGGQERDSKRRKTDGQPQVSSDSGVDLGVDAEALLLHGEDAESREQQAIEARRRRLAEIKRKHEQQAAITDSIVAPTASELAGSSRAGFPSHGSTAQLSSMGGAGEGDGVEAAGEGEVSRQVPAAGEEAGEGERTPEGDRTSSSDDEGPATGPVVDIFQQVPVAGGDDEVLAAEADQATQPPPSHPPAQQQQQQQDEEDDLFALAAASPKQQQGSDSAGMFASDDEAGKRPGQPTRKGAIRNAGLAEDACDDSEGYYKPQVGEMLDQRYKLVVELGKGVFGAVWRAQDMARKDDQGNNPEVAIKMIRSNETMYKAAQTELMVLRRLASSDPDNRKHCIRLIRHFEHRRHMSLVFEPMEMNLRDLCKKYGRNKGLNLEAVQLFTCQLLMALRHLQKNQVIHADLKPDNILINHRRNKVKLCDFGSAMLLGDNDITPYLVARYYRPPEVMLGMKYDHAVDMWSLGCVVYELFCGRILFPGHTNNEMIKLMMDVKGPFTKKMLRKCVFGDKHFDIQDPNCPFISLEEHPITKTTVRKLVPISTITPKTNFSTLLSKASGDKSKIAMLADLLEKMMMLEPERRIDPDAALRHPFVKEVLPRKDHHHKKSHKKE